MIIGRALRRAAVAAGAVVAAGCFQAAPASAQLFWDWGGGSMVDGSGREVVRFSPQFPKGQIIVSFGDRRLYFVTRPGEAISYPIAIPREESRWQGNTTVTSKRDQSVVDADADHDRRESAPAALGAGRPSHEPARRARALSGLEHLSHPRHGRALDHRHGRLQGLHPHVQPGRAGPLSARVRRRQGDRHLAASSARSRAAAAAAAAFGSDDDERPSRPQVAATVKKVSRAQTQ